MHDRYGSMAAMLAAYAGPRRYDAHLASGRALPAETVDYVAKIAPMIDGQGPVMRLAGIASRASWSRGPIFVGRSAVHPDDGSTTSIFLPADHRTRLRSSICRRSCRRPMASSCEDALRWRTAMSIVFPLRGERNRRDGREPGAPQATTAGRQDKKPHIAAWTVGCFVCGFSDLLHIADQHRDVRVIHFANDFSEYRTSWTQP
jgi:hypothetical protein